MEVVGQVKATAEKPREILKDQETMQKCLSLGEKLVLEK
jgi:hypothetical protein